MSAEEKNGDQAAKPAVKLNMTPAAKPITPKPVAAPVAATPASKADVAEVPKKISPLGAKIPAGSKVPEAGVAKPKVPGPATGKKPGLGAPRKAVPGVAAKKGGSLAAAAAAARKAQVTSKAKAAGTDKIKEKAAKKAGSAPKAAPKVAPKVAPKTAAKAAPKLGKKVATPADDSGDFDMDSMAEAVAPKCGLSIAVAVLTLIIAILSIGVLFIGQAGPSVMPGLRQQVNSIADMVGGGNADAAGSPTAEALALLEKTQRDLGDAKSVLSVERDDIDSIDEGQPEVGVDTDNALEPEPEPIEEVDATVIDEPLVEDSSDDMVGVELLEEVDEEIGADAIVEDLLGEDSDDSLGEEMLEEIESDEGELELDIEDELDLTEDL